MDSDDSLARARRHRRVPIGPAPSYQRKDTEAEAAWKDPFVRADVESWFRRPFRSGDTMIVRFETRGVQRTARFVVTPLRLLGRECEAVTDPESKTIFAAREVKNDAPSTPRAPS